MRKAFSIAAVLTVVGALALGGTARADDSQTCVKGSLGAIALGGGPAETVTCSYAATGAGSYSAATPNSWKIEAVRGEETILLASSESLQMPSNGSLASQAGDTVVITIGAGASGDVECVEGTPACGTAGMVSAGNV